ncbi:MAG TPA: hypothetical protein VFH29_09710 [Anaerolineales bacterium]|nr:hypothetical protein [Anaerolineales bacterium]
MSRYFILCLPLASFVLSACTTPAVPNAPTYPAVIQADCAPWDGAAFTLSIPFDTGRLARVSIYRAPDLPSRTRFSFPDATGRIGNAIYQPEFGEAQTITGSLTFDAVRRDAPASGEFDWQTADGLRMRGRFNAKWIQGQALCG